MTCWLTYIKSGGVNVVFADLGNPDRLDELLQAQQCETGLAETRSNPLLRLVDIKALAAKHAAGALVGIDNTFATPHLQQPLEMGCDSCSTRYQIPLRTLRRIDGHRCG